MRAKKSDKTQEFEMNSSCLQRMTEENEKRLDIRGAAWYTGYSVNYIYKLTAGGKIPFFKPRNGKLFFRICDLDEFLSQNKHLADYQVRDLADSYLAEKPKRIVRKARR